LTLIKIKTLLLADDGVKVTDKFVIAVYEELVVVSFAGSLADFNCKIPPPLLAKLKTPLPFV
jgi:hypothetical protein